MTNLRGSEKQIAWAEQIRKTTLEKINKEIELANRMLEAGKERGNVEKTASWQRKLNHLTSEKNELENNDGFAESKIWIENRNAADIIIRKSNEVM